MKQVEKYFELFAVPENHTRKFVNNAVVLAENVVLPAARVATEDWLKTKGFPQGGLLDRFISLEDWQSELIRSRLVDNF